MHMIGQRQTYWGKSAEKRWLLLGGGAKLTQVALGAFILGNFFLVLQSQGDVIQAIQQAVTTVLLDFEGDAQPHGIANLALFQIDRQAIRRMGLGFSKEFINLGFRKLDWEHSVLEAVVKKYIGKRWRQDSANAIIVQGPNRVFSAGSAAEIAASQQNTSILDRWLIQLKARVVRTIVQEPPVKEKELTKTGALDALEELFGDDLIGIHVGSIQRCHDTLMNGKSSHGYLTRMLTTGNPTVGYP